MEEAGGEDLLDGGVVDGGWLGSCVTFRFG